MGCFSSKPGPQNRRHEGRGTAVSKPTHGAAQAPSSAPNSGGGEPAFGCEQYYKVLELLGEGGSGQTFLCEDRKTGEELAVKFMARPIPRVVQPMIFHEVKIQSSLGEGHVNLVQARACILTKSHLALGMEYACGGTLTDYVTSKFDTIGQRNGLFLDEAEARYFFKQYIAAVEYLHINHVAHRDLKLDNIVLNKDDPPCIKLCDFGFAKNWEDQSNMFTQIGTPVYMSPQLINSKSTEEGYDAQKADVWACGVLLFVMMLGMFPFDSSDPNADPNSTEARAEVWLQQIKSNWREAPRIAESAKLLSPECQDLLDKMFDLEESRRISIPEICAHPWTNKPMSEKHTRALEQLTETQKGKNSKLQAGLYQSEERIATLQTLIEKAGSKGGPDEPVVIVPLARPKTVGVEGDLNAPSMTAIHEE